MIVESEFIFNKKFLAQVIISQFDLLCPSNNFENDEPNTDS